MSEFLSVIIPAYNREEKLKIVLDSLAKQTYPRNKFEVLVIDDGSGETTREMLKSSEPLLKLRYFKGENKGANAARNLGIKEAGGEIIFFTGDDIVLDKNLLSEHMKYQEKYDKVVVIGKTLPWPKFTETPFRKFMQLRSENRYRDLKRHKENLRGAHTFSAGNSSLPREVLFELGLFDEDLKKYGWQDIEFGYRLERRKIKRVFNENALAYHYHYVDFETFCRRMVQVGWGAVIVWRKHPELKIFLGLHFFNFGIDKIFFPFGKGVKLIKKIISFSEKKNLKFLVGICYDLLSNHYYLKGVKEILKKNKKKFDIAFFI
jgi:glycosyltransferase involved in cell wall biosynthesis